MTMLSFRVGEGEAGEAQRWADSLGVDRSELLRDALHRYLAGLRAEHESSVWEDSPLTKAELSLASIADWGPAEDWTDWDDEAR